MLALTRGDIIGQGLAVAARPDLTSDARLWLNLYLEEIYHNQDFDWLVKTLTSVPATEGYALASDYRAAKSATLIDTSSNVRQLNVVSDAAEWDQLRRNYRNTQTSVPEHVYINHDLRQMYFLPEAAAGITIEFKYFYFPTLPDHTNAGTDTEVPKWGLPAQILVDAIKSKAMEYNDDQRQDNAAMGVQKKIVEAKMNSGDRRAGRSKLAMGKSFSRRFGNYGSSNT